MTTVCPLAMSTGMFHFPKSSFPDLFGTLVPEEAAKRAIHGILTNQVLVCVPKTFEYLFRFSEITPSKVAIAVQQFINYGVDAHTHDKIKSM
jgi:hypothetical protein